MFVKIRNKSIFQNEKKEATLGSILPNENFKTHYLTSRFEIMFEFLGGLPDYNSDFLKYETIEQFNKAKELLESAMKNHDGFVDISIDTVQTELNIETTL